MATRRDVLAALFGKGGPLHGPSKALKESVIPPTQQRRTIPELELLSELIRRSGQRKIEDPSLSNEDRIKAFYQAGSQKQPNTDNLRRRFALREMKLLRQEALPGIGRQAERDRIRRALGTAVTDHAAGIFQKALPRNAKDLGEWEQDMSLAVHPNSPAWTGGTEDIAPSLKLYEALKEKGNLEGLKRKMSPILRILDQRKMERREVLRLGGRGLAKAASMSPTGQAVKQLATAGLGQEAPFLTKILKALISRKFR